MSENVQEFRAYLQGELDKRKLKNPRYSLRAFAKALHLSPAQLSQILSGKRVLTMKVADRICDRLSLSPRQKRKLLLESLFQAAQNSDKYHDLKEDEFRLISEWYHLAILSLSKLKDSKSDAGWIAERLGITRQEAADALYRLERLGILQRGAQLKQIGDPIRMVSDVPSPAIRSFHRQALELALKALDEVPVTTRDFSSVNLLLRADQLKKVSELIEDFQNQVAETMEDPKGGEVHCLNVQLFPVKFKQGEKR